MTADNQGLRRGLTRWHAVAIVVGSVVGTGIYIRPASVAQLVGTPSSILIVWMSAGLLSLAGAMTYAELAARIPRSGGEYAFLRTTLGEAPAFLFGWMRLTVSVGTCAALAVAVTVFLSDLLPFGAAWTRFEVPWPGASIWIDVGPRQALAVLIIVGLAALNLRGVGHAGRFQSWVTSLKVIGLLGLIAGVLVLGHGSAAMAPAMASVPAPAANPMAFSAALLAAMVAFNGWASVAMLAGEVKDAESTVPWALTWGIVGVIALYLLANLAYLHVLPLSAIQGANSTAHPAAPSVASRAALAALGPKAGVVLSVLFIVSALGTLHCNLMAVPRVFFAMARDGLLPAALGSVSATARTPAIAILAVAVIAAILAVVGNYDRLSGMATFGNIAFFALNAWGLLHWSGARESGLRAPHRRWIPWLFLVGSGWLLATLIAQGSVEVVSALVLIAAGIPVYLGICAWRRTG